jgi:Holliday junction DNA helicase RuvB
MGREKIVDRTSYDVIEQEFFEQLRPRRLNEVVGQRRVVERLRVALEASQQRREPFPHLLLDGPPGIGKTTLATVLPREMGVDFQLTSGAALSSPKDLIPYLTNATERSVIFIDEIHRLPRAVEEFLYPAMEDFRIDFVIGEGIHARTINMPLKPLTIIGATTRTGLVSGPLRERFLIHEHLDFYEVEDLAEIVRRNAARLKVRISEEACQEIARRSRGTPRLANARLRWVRDFATTRAGGDITATVAREALQMLEVDEEGLDAQDRRYLETLIRVYDGGPAGVEALAATMNLSVDTLADEVEPYLLRRGFIIRTPRGRQATEEAYRHLGWKPSRRDEGQRRLF